MDIGIWPRDGGEMGELVRAHDWAASPLGEIGCWPERLRAAVDACLDAVLPTFVWWGDNLIQFHNDAALAIIGGRSAGLGRPARETWREAWPVIGPLVEEVRRTGRAVQARAQGEERFTFSYGPLRDEGGAVAGLFVTAIETGAARVTVEQAFQRFFAASLTPVLVLAPDAPRFTIVEANDAFLAAAGRTRDALIGRDVFGTIPGEPNEAAAAALRASLERALASRRADAMPNQRYSLRRADGGFEERWWDCVNTPVLGADGHVEAIVHHTRDVTDRHRARMRLRESEERHRLILESALDYAIFTMDLRGMITEWPPGAQAVYGGTPEEMVGRDAAITFVPEDRATNQPEKERALARDQGFSPNVRWHLRIDGARVFIEGSVRPLRDARGEVIGFLKIGRDATEQLRVQEALRASEERFRQFGDASADALWIVDAATARLEYLSPAFEAMWGESRDRVLANLSRWADFVHPDDRERALSGMPRLLAGERAINEYRIVRPDGEVRWIQDVGFPIRDDAGRVVRVAGIAQDQTERREAEDRLRTLMEGIPQLVWRSADEGWWTWSSPQWQAFTGQSLEESLGRGWLDAVHPDDREGARRAWAQARSDGFLDLEYRVRHAPSGDYLWHHTRSAPVRDASGRIVEWLGTTTDVQQLKELQERQAVMVAELQHRTRNLIAVVRSIVGQTMSAARSMEDFQATFNDRLGALARVQGLLSRSEQEPITIEALVRMELDALGGPNGTRHRIALEGPPVRIRPSVVQTLALALHELATNARKYGALSTERGSLTVQWRAYDEDGEPRLVLEWIEQGVGPAPDPADADRRGYGRELIERALPYALHARTRYEIDAAGVRCAIDMPLDKARGRRDAR